MANEAYRVLADTSIPKAVDRLEDGPEGEARYSHTGVAYSEGDYVFASEITPPLRERAENGELDHILEPCSLDEAQEARAVVEVGTFIPEHEAEAVILDNYGHRTVPKDQLLELKSAGADAAKEAIEASREDDADQRPNLTEPDRPSLVEVSNDKEGKVDNVPSESEHVDDEVLEASGVEQPPGVPVGKAKAAAEGADVESERKPRSRPQRSSTRKQEQAAQSAREKQEGNE
jgi:hypothetical protein